MILKMFTYPSKDESMEVSKLFPDINRFGFKEFNLMLIWEREKTMEEACVLQNLLEWDQLLNEKLWNFRQCFENALVNYNRGIPLNKEDYKNANKITNLLQFGLYCEMAFFYLISTRDIILQIINLAFGLGFKDSSVTATRIVKELEIIKNYAVLEIVNKMLTDLEDATEIRNSSTHRFSKLTSDGRSTLSDDQRTYNAGTRKFIKHDDQVRILKEAVSCFCDFFHSIEEKLSEKGLLS